MKLSFIVPLLAANLAIYAQEAMPRMTTVEPQAGKIGDVVAVAGDLNRRIGMPSMIAAHA